MSYFGIYFVYNKHFVRMCLFSLTNPYLGDKIFLYTNISNEDYYGQQNFYASAYF